MHFSTKDTPKRRIDTILSLNDPGKQGIMNDIINLIFQNISKLKLIVNNAISFIQNHKKTKGTRNSITYKDIAAQFGETEPNICYFTRT